MCKDIDVSNNGHCVDVINIVAVLIVDNLSATSPDDNVADNVRTGLTPTVQTLSATLWSGNPGPMIVTSCYYY